MRRNFCQACTFVRYGVRTRRALECTCGQHIMPVVEKRQYIPSREELERYIARLKDFWDEDKQEWKKM